MQSGNKLYEEEQCGQKNRRSDGDSDSTNFTRSRSRSRSRIKTLIGSLYTPLKFVRRELKKALRTSAQNDTKLMKDEQLEERKGPSNDDGDCDNSSLARSISRTRIENLIGSLQAPMKSLGKELKSAAIMSAQIYCYTWAFYYHFLLHKLGSPLPPPPISINEINELVLSVNEGPGTPVDHTPCSTSEEEFQSNQELGMVLPCGQRFHGHCISKWLENNNFCPLCRFILHDADGTMLSNENQQDNDEGTLKPSI